MVYRDCVRVRPMVIRGTIREMIGSGGAKMCFSTRDYGYQFDWHCLDFDIYNALKKYIH